MANMSKKWIILCTAALGGIYTAEYAAANMLTPVQPAGQVYSSQPAPSSGLGDRLPPAVEPSPSPSLDASPSPTVSEAPRTYKDGTYTGLGRNRRGSIEVTVTINNDKISDVQISHFAMHYSESDVVGLPDEVLQYQSADVDNVSGATYSTRAFSDAVQDALDQARNA